MRQLLLTSMFASYLLAAFSFAGETKLKSFNSKDLVHPAGAGIMIQENTTGDAAVVIVENATSKPIKAELLRIEAPPIHAVHYAVKGEVKYQEVAPQGYLEMWNYFSQGAFFSRTLGTEGPMAALSGTSDWRAFLLPFNSTGATGAPQRLVINVQLPGKGRVELRNLELVEYSDEAAAACERSERWAVILGSVGGVILASLGARSWSGWPRKVWRSKQF